MDLGLLFFAIAILAFFIRIYFYKEKKPQMLVIMMIALVFSWLAGYWISFPMHTVTNTTAIVSNVPLFCLSNLTGSSNYVYATPPNPSVSSTSATYQMAGVGNAVAITPKYSGTIEIYWVNHGVGSVSSSTVREELEYGTGTAPIEGDSVTGTHIIAPSVGYIEVSPSTTGEEPIVFFTKVSGLTIGTQYWFDAAFARSSGGGTVTLDDFMVNLNEVPNTGNTLSAPIPCPTTSQTTHTMVYTYPDQPAYDSFQIYMIWIGIFAWTICCILYMTFDAIMISYAMKKAKGELDE